MKKLDVSKYNSGGELAEIAIKVNEIIDNGTAGCGECQKKVDALIEKYMCHLYKTDLGYSSMQDVLTDFLQEYKKLI